MSVCSKYNNFCWIILNKHVRTASTYVARHSSIEPSQFSRQKLVNQNISFRKIATSNNYSANISFNLTDIGEGIREVVVKEWFVKTGDRVAQFDNICEVQSDKASVTITSRYDGTITKLHYNIEEIAHVGKPLIDIETEADEQKNIVVEKTTNQDGELQAEQYNPKDYKKTLCVPSVRRIAKEHDVDLSQVKGTGKDGRVLKEDILNFLQLLQPEDSNAIIAPEIQKSSFETDRVEKVHGFKKVMIKTMTDALKIPHFLYCDEISVTKLNKIRNAIKKDAEDAGVKLTILPFLIKAVSNALNEYPILNASLDSNNENIIYKSSHNIGVAMNSSLGLAVPVIQNANKLSIFEISKELNRLMKSGKQGSFTPNDLSGGTFSISNIGAIGGTYTAPIIFPPQVSIIAIGAIRVLPRFDSSNNLVREEIINLSGSADHRIIDGATMTHFVNSVKRQIENPYLLFLST